MESTGRQETQIANNGRYGQRGPLPRESVAAGSSDGASDVPASSPSLTHGICDDFAQVFALKDAWNDLAGRAGDLFSSYDWCQTWWRHFGTDRKLEIHTLHDGERLVAVLPLFRETLRLGGVRLRAVRVVAGDYTIDAAGLAIEPYIAGPFFATVLDRLADRGSWDILHVGPLRSYVDVADRFVETAREHEQVQSVLIGRQNDWLTAYDLPATYDGYLHSLAGSERRDTTRRERKLREEHDVRIEAVRDSGQVSEAMDNLVKWHQSLWVGKGQRGQFVDWPGFEEFHREVAQRLAARGQLLLVHLNVDGESLGAAYGYHFGPRSHAMVRGYRDDGPWRRYALGRLLHCHMVEQSIGRGSKVLDDGRGVFDYKLRLGGQLRGERSVTLVRRGRASHLRFWAALRAAYLLHVVYCRIWFDRVAPRIGWSRPLRRAYIRSSFLAQLHRRVRLPLWAAPKVQELRCAAPLLCQRANSCGQKR